MLDDFLLVNIDAIMREAAIELLRVIHPCILYDCFHEQVEPQWYLNYNDAARGAEALQGSNWNKTYKIIQLGAPECDSLFS